jgi:hypothetical protein
MFIRDGVLKQNVRHICRLAVTLHECRPAPDNPYYRGLGCADFSKQRRPGSAVGIIGGFSPIALKINDPRREVLLAPAHRPRCISSRSPKFAASMKPKLKLWLVISASRPLSVFKSGRKPETSAGPDDGITAKRDRAKILGGMSHSCCRLSGRDT